MPERIQISQLISCYIFQIVIAYSMCFNVVQPLFVSFISLKYDQHLSLPKLVEEFNVIIIETFYATWSALLIIFSNSFTFANFQLSTNNGFLTQVEYKKQKMYFSSIHISPAYPATQPWICCGIWMNGNQKWFATLHRLTFRLPLSW